MRNLLRTSFMARARMMTAALLLLLLLGPSGTRFQQSLLHRNYEEEPSNFDKRNGNAHKTETRLLTELLQRRKPSRSGSRTRQEDLMQATTTRKKRATLIWPSGSIFVAEFFFTIPITAPTGVTIPFKVEVPYKFTLPNFTTSNFLGRSRKDERLDFYGIMEGLIAKFGVDGKACVLRAVCEQADTQLLGAGLLGEIISTILAASSATSSEEMEEYVRAEYLGRWLGDCSSSYPNCPVSLFNWLK